MRQPLYRGQVSVAYGLWAVTFASAVAVAYLCISTAQNAPRHHAAVERVYSPAEAPGPIAPPVAAVELGKKPAIAGASRDPSGGAEPPIEKQRDREGPEEKREGESAGVAGAGARPAPQEFLDHLMELARKGDMEALARYMSPGFSRVAQNLLMLILMAKTGEKEKERLGRVLGDLQFEPEELGGGLFRIHVAGPEGQGPPEEIYLVASEDSWQLVTESDLPGPAADFRRALSRLRLLAICQHTYLTENLGGGEAGYAETAYDLAAGLNRSPVYADVLDGDFVTAVDRGLPLQGYGFGTIERGAKGFAYYATPLSYGAEFRETIVIDTEGRIWAKDLGGEPPPATWPGPDPEKQGWKRRKSLWD